MNYSKGDIVLVDLEPTLGSEQGFKRPVIIVSSLETITASRSKPLYVIVPLTRSEKLIGSLAPRLKARQDGLPSDSTALIMHLRSIDPQRVLRFIGKLNEGELELIQKGLKELFGLA
jgi:mRNA interferase MazF